MSDKHPFPAEFQKRLYRFPLARGSGDHFVRNTGQFGDICRYRHTGIDKCRKGIGYFAVFIFKCADLGYSAGLEGKPRRFYIEDDKFILREIDIVFFVIMKNRTGGIIRKIPFDPVYRLDIRVLFRRRHDYRISLQRAVVGKSNGGHTPFVGAGDDIRRVGKRIERGHIRVEMQLHAFFLRLILPAVNLAAADRLDVYRKLGILDHRFCFAVENTAVVGSAVNDHISGRLRKLGRFALRTGEARGYRAFQIGKIKGIGYLIALVIILALCQKQLAADANRASRLDTGYRRERPAFTFAHYGHKFGYIQCQPADMDKPLPVRFEIFRFGGNNVFQRGTRNGLVCRFELYRFLLCGKRIQKLRGKDIRAIVAVFGGIYLLIFEVVGERFVKAFANALHYKQPCAVFLGYGRADIRAQPYNRTVSTVIIKILRAVEKAVIKL